MVPRLRIEKMEPRQTQTTKHKPSLEGTSQWDTQKPANKFSNACLALIDKNIAEVIKDFPTEQLSTKKF